jgi:hypothetical protein
MPQSLNGHLRQLLLKVKLLLKVNNENGDKIRINLGNKNLYIPRNKLEKSYCMTGFTITRRQHH